MELESILEQEGKPTDAVAAFFIRDGRLLIGLRNYTKGTWKDISVWTAPAGRCDEGETLGKTLRREVNEEVGIVGFDIVSSLGQLPGAKDGDCLYVFHCVTDQDATLMEPEKFSEWRWCPISEIPENFINPLSLELLKDIK